MLGHKPADSKALESILVAIEDKNGNTIGQALPQLVVYMGMHSEIILRLYFFIFLFTAAQTDTDNILIAAAQQEPKVAGKHLHITYGVCTDGTLFSFARVGADRYRSRDSS